MKAAYIPKIAEATDMARLYARALLLTPEQFAAARSKSRRVEACAIRRQIYRFLHRLGYGTPTIGAVFHRDHTTVMHALGMR